MVLKCLKGMANLNPPTPYRPPDWSLDLVLQYILDNKDNNSLLFLSCKTLFLVALCLGSRISELMSLKRDNNSFIRMGDSSIKIFPDPKFLAKN